MNEEVFWKNQECLQSIPEIVSCLRKQRYFSGSKKLEELIRHLSVITEYIFQLQNPEINQAEWLQI